MDQMSSTEAGVSGVIQHKAYARVGLLGNPSDVYFGKTISFSVGNFWASVKLEPSHQLVIKPHPTHDLVQFNSLDHLVLSFSCNLQIYLFIFAWLGVYVCRIC